MALPMLCIDRQTISIIIEFDSAAIAEEIINIIIPQENNFLIPIMSAILPNGSDNTESAKTNEVTNQPKRIASAWNSRFILGRAILRDEDINAGKKEASE
jgi:hypothetical protein